MFLKVWLRTLVIGAALGVLALPASPAQAQRGDIVETAVNAGSFSTLAAALTEAGLVDDLKGDGPFTVFAPTDEAFAKLGQGTINDLLKPENRDTLVRILTYHVAAGKLNSGTLAQRRELTTLSGQRVDLGFKNGALLVEKSRVVTANIETTNGVIHVIDTVLIPENGTIVDVASSAGSFSTLLAAAKAAGLAGALAGDGPFTVFAPTDEAFEKLGQGTISDLLKPRNRERLANILKLHVVPGRVYASDVAAGAEADTLLQGQRVRVAPGSGGLTVNGANIVATDIEASNGVIHVIDTVLQPRPEGRLVVGIFDSNVERETRARLGLASGEGIATAAPSTPGCSRAMSSSPSTASPRPPSG